MMYSETMLRRKRQKAASVQKLKYYCVNGSKGN